MSFLSFALLMFDSGLCQHCLQAYPAAWLVAEASNLTSQGNFGRSIGVFQYRTFLECELFWIKTSNPIMHFVHIWYYSNKQRFSILMMWRMVKALASELYASSISFTRRFSQTMKLVVLQFPFENHTLSFSCLNQDLRPFLWPSNNTTLTVTVPLYITQCWLFPFFCNDHFEAFG